MSKENSKNQRNIKLFLLIFLFIQPILDVFYSVGINYFQVPLFINTIIRFLFLGISVFYLLFLCNEKKFKIATIFILIYMLFFLINIYVYKDINALLYEGKNLITTFYFPLCLMFVINIFNRYKIEIKKENWIILFLIYLFFIIVPNIIGLGFNTYSNEKSGLIGWFYSANAVGSILTILIPITTLFFIEKKKLMLGVIYSFSTFYIFFSIGTKAPILGLCVYFILILCLIIFKAFKQKKYKVISIIGGSTFISIILIILIIPQTNFYKNIKLHMKYFNINSVSDVYKNKYFINQIIFSERLDFLNKTKTNYKESNLSEKILGIGYIENYKLENESLKTIEIDYLDIFYRHGPVGFIIYFLPLILIILNFIKRIIPINFEKYSYIISLILAFLLVFFSGHIFITPAVSIILIYIISNFRTICEQDIKGEKNE